MIAASPPLSKPSVGPLPSRASPGPAPNASDSERRAFRLIARGEAEKAGVPFDLVDAVMKIESGYVPTRIGDLDELGLMQVRPGTAAMLGFTGAEGSLLTPAVNIHYGTTYLGAAWRLAGGNVCRALMKYRAGHGSETMSALSMSYCAKAKAHLASIGSPLAAGIGDVGFVPVVADPAPSLREPNVMPRSGPAFWAVFKARIKRINTRIESKWRHAGVR